MRAGLLKLLGMFCDSSVLTFWIFVCTSLQQSHPAFCLTLCLLCCAIDLYAYDNGAVATNVQENYSVLWSRRNAPMFAPELVEFLDKLYIILENAPLDDKS